MKLLFDQNLSFKLCRQLEDLYPGSMQTGLLGLGGADDRAVRGVARDGGYVLVTQHADFTEMAAPIGPPPKVVWLRCGNRPTKHVADLIRRHVATVEALVANDQLTCLGVD